MVKAVDIYLAKTGDCLDKCRVYELSLRLRTLKVIKSILLDSQNTQNINIQVGARNVIFCRPVKIVTS